MFSEQSTIFDGLLAEKALKGPAWAGKIASNAEVENYTEVVSILPQNYPTVESTCVNLGNVWAALPEPLVGHTTRDITATRKVAQQTKTISAVDLIARNLFVHPLDHFAGSFLRTAVVGLGSSADMNLLPIEDVYVLYSPTIESENWKVDYIGEESRNFWEDKDAGGRETSKIEHIAGQLRNLPNLHDNWDGYGGVAPERDAVEYAIDFLNLASKEINDLPMPRPSLAGSGEVGVYWSFDEHGFYGDIGFFADGRMNYYVEAKSGRFASEGGIKFDRNKLPDRLINLLKELCSGGN